MMKWKKGAAGILIVYLGLTAFISGCSGKETESRKEKDITIGVVTKSKDSEYWMTVCSGMEKAAKDMGASVMIVSPDTETNDKLQKKMIEDLIQKDVDALAVSPIQSYDVDGYLNEASKRKIPVYSYDTEIVSEGVPYIGIDNEKAGRELASYMAQALGQKGKVGIISGDLNQTAHKDRMTGFKSYIEENTEIEIAFTESGYSNLQMSEKEISRLMEEHPDIDGILATSAVTALGIMEYMKDTSVLIATVDAQQDAIEAVKDGRIAALAAQSGYDIGYETVCYILNDMNGKKQDMEKILEVDIITRENVQDWKE